MLVGGGVHGEVRVGQGEEQALNEEGIFSRVQAALSRRRKSVAQYNSKSVKLPTNR